MHDWVEVSDRLREIQAATEHFAVRGAIEQWIIGPMLLDRLAEDLEAERRAKAKLQPWRQKDDGREQ